MNSSTKNRKVVLFLAISVLLATGLLIVFAFQDIAISEQLYNNESIFGIAFETFGLWPGILPIPIFAATWCAKKAPTEYKMIAIVFLAGGSAGLWYKTFDELAENGIVKEIPYLWLAVATIILAVVIFFVVNKLHINTLVKLSFVCEVGTVYFFVYNVIGGGIKLLWGRWRYFEMLELGNLDKFSPWYMPQGYNGHTSFPSGHVMASCGIFIMLLYVIIQTKNKGAHAFATLGCSMYVFCMAVSRIIMGRHFASDTVMGILIGIFVFTAILNSSRYKKVYNYYRYEADKVKRRV